jgi:hypothetical protein
MKCSVFVCAQITVNLSEMHKKLEENEYSLIILVAQNFCIIRVSSKYVVCTLWLASAIRVPQEHPFREWKKITLSL